MADSRICSIEGCGKVHYRRGWCSAHYRRWLKYGDPFGGGRVRPSKGVPLAFLEGTVLPFEGEECLIWPYGTNGAGYAQMRHNSKTRRVHRIVCEVQNGPPPTPDHEAAHSCGKGHEGCVNPKHLVWKTPKENAADRLVHGTGNWGRRNGQSKLAETQVLEIQSAHGTHAAIAKIFGVSRATVSQIRSGKMWKHIYTSSHTSKPRRPLKR